MPSGLRIVQSSPIDLYAQVGTLLDPQQAVVVDVHGSICLVDMNTTRVRKLFTLPPRARVISVFVFEDLIGFRAEYQVDKQLVMLYDLGGAEVYRSEEVRSYHVSYDRHELTLVQRDGVIVSFKNGVTDRIQFRFDGSMSAIPDGMRNFFWIMTDNVYLYNYVSDKTIFVSRSPGSTYIYKSTHRCVCWMDGGQSLYCMSRYNVYLETLLRTVGLYCQPGSRRVILQMDKPIPFQPMLITSKQIVLKTVSGVEVRNWSGQLIDSIQSTGEFSRSVFCRGEYAFFLRTNLSNLTTWRLRLD